MTVHNTKSVQNSLFNRFKKNLLFIAVTTWLAFASSTAVATDGSDDFFSISLQDLSSLTVRSTGFFDTTLARAPNNITILTHQDFETLPGLTLEDYIQHYVPGARLARSANFGLVFAARGNAAGPTNGLVLWDGQRLTMRNGDGFRIGYSSPLLGDLERTEVVLGPASIVHGNGAFAGYVNFVPKSGADHQGTTIRSTLGPTDRLVKFESGYGKSYGDERNFYLYAGLLQSRGHRYNSSFAGQTQNPQLFSQREYVNEYDPSFKLSSNWRHDRFKVTALLERLDADPNSLLANANQIQRRTTFALQPSYTFELSNNEFIDFTPSVAYFDNGRIFKPRFPDSPARFDDGGSESATEFDVIFRSQRFANHNIAFGAHYTWRDIRSRQQFFSGDTNENSKYVDGKWQEYAVFVEDRIDLNDNMSLTLGLREDRTRFGRFESEAARFPNLAFTPNDITNRSPRAAFVYETDDNRTFKLSYQEGFQFPNLDAYPRSIAVRNFLLSVGEQPLPELEPDVLESFELAYADSFLDETLKLDVNLYHNSFDNTSTFRILRNEPLLFPQEIIDMLPAGLNGTTFKSGLSFSSIGGEIELTWNPNPDLRGGFSYAYSRPSRLSKEENDILILANDDVSEWRRYPKHILKGYALKNFGPWSVAVSGIYESGVVNTLNSNIPKIFDDNHFRMNSLISYAINEQFTVSFLTKNLFKNGTPKSNAPIIPWNGTLGSDERTFYFTLEWLQ